MKYVALLRGINVGGNNKVPMTELKLCFETLGYQNVSTYINSGNVTFEIKTTSESVLAKKIEEAILKSFNFPIRVVVINEQVFSNISKSIPVNWENNSEQKTDILFLWDDYDNKKSLDLIKAKVGIDNLKYVPGVILWNIKKKDYNQSGMNDFIKSELYKNMTARNVNTVRKITALLKENC